MHFKPQPAMKGAQGGWGEQNEKPNLPLTSKGSFPSTQTLNIYNLGNKNCLKEQT